MLAGDFVRNRLARERGIDPDKLGYRSRHKAKVTV